jgi:hypothetical protein
MMAPHRLRASHPASEAAALGAYIAVITHEYPAASGLTFTCCSHMWKQFLHRTFLRLAKSQPDLVTPVGRDPMLHLMFHPHK